MDCQMSILSGYEAAADIRKAEKDLGTKHLTIVAITANAVEEIVRGAWRRGWTITSPNRSGSIR